MGSVDNFSSHEALLIIGELTVQLRRTESELDACQGQLRDCMAHNNQLHNEMENAIENPTAYAFVEEG